MSVTRQESLVDLQIDCRKRIAEIHRTHGFFPSSHRLLLSRDPAFTFKRRLRVFATTPHLRPSLIASFFVHLFRVGRKTGRGRSRLLDASSRLSGDASSFYFNALIADLLEASRRDTQPEDWEAAMDAEMAGEFEADTLEYPQAGGLIKAWGYFPIKLHRFHPGNAVYRLMHQWGALEADLDSSSMVFVRLLKRGSILAKGPAVLTLLEEHVRGLGRHGKNRLAYDNGATEADQGVLLWVQEKHNELDAGVNLNVLCLLAALMERTDGPDRERTARLSSLALDFLDRHIDLGSYGSKAFLMFYSLEAFAFLWHRLQLGLDSMPAALRAAFDPKDVCGRLGRHLCVLVEKEIARGVPEFNSFDKLLVIPLLVRMGSPAAKAMISVPALRSLLEDVSASTFEFGKFIYPFTFLYGNRALGLCVALSAIREIAAARRSGY